MSAATLSMPPLAVPAAFALTQAEAERLTGGSWHGARREVVVHGASIDSRAVIPGGIFACLPGAKRDGHDFAATAVGDGAALVLATRPVAVPVPVLVVADVTRALGQLATEFRRRYRGATWIGVTGSNGKTTVKELLAAACSGGQQQVHATRGNLNNHLGVPVTVLNTPAGVTHAVIEMGANHAGEIAYLCGICRPQVGVITAIAPAHLEGFGDLAGVAKAKSELFAALPEGATALLGLHGLSATCDALGCDPAMIVAAIQAAALGRRLVLIGSREWPVIGDVLDDGVLLRTSAGLVEVKLLGAHNLANAALAYQAALAAGIAPEHALRGLGSAAAVSGRLQARHLGAHLILDDSYNANPASMVAGLQVLARHQGRRLAVLGAMGELGAGSAAGHAQVGAEAARLGVSLVTVGERARAIFDAYRANGGSDGVHADTRELAIELVRHRFSVGATTVLVKASRSAGLETVVEGLLASVEGGSA